MIYHIHGTGRNGPILLNVLEGPESNLDILYIAFWSSNPAHIEELCKKWDITVSDNFRRTRAFIKWLIKAKGFSEVTYETFYSGEQA